MTSVSEQPRPRRWPGILFNVAACVAVLSGAGAAIVYINQTEPTAQQINTRRKSAALVETIAVTRGSFTPKLVVLGTVQPAQSIGLSPRVSGQVIELADNFAPGGMVSTGDLLLRLDPTDFENALKIRESELKQAEAQLEIEKGRQSLAKDQLELLGDSVNDSNRALVLREPQFKSIQSQVSAAQVAIERAKLELDRSRVVAPFDAQVLRRTVDVGSQISTGQEIARLVGIDEYWIMAAVPVRSLRWVQFPADAKSEAIENPSDDPNATALTGSRVDLRSSDAWGPGVERPAQVTRMIGTLDEETRLARVLITVKDPLGRTSDVPPLILDTLVEVRIHGKQIDNVCRLSRAYVHEGDTVWVFKDNELEIRETSVAFRDADYVYIRDGLNDGDEVVTTTLATVANGVGLRKMNADDNPNADSEQESAE